MSPEKIIEELNRRVTPVMTELGFDGFVVIGYAIDENGNRQRRHMARIGEDVAVQDGLMPVAQFAQQWCRPIIVIAPPKPETQSEPA